MRMTIILNEQEREALIKAAKMDMRYPRDHVRFILRQEFERRGLLPEQDQAGHPAGGQGGQHGHQ